MRCLSLFTALIVFFLGGVAQACNVPNPNLLAPPWVDGCDLPAVSLNNLSSNSTAGYFLQFGAPPIALVSWLNSNNFAGKNPYGYLGRYGELVVPNNYGSNAIVGASRSSLGSASTLPPSMGLVGVAINDNTTTVQSSWPLYLTGGRLANTGSIQSELDLFNFGTLIHVGSYIVNPTGMVTDLAVQCGGEPVAPPNSLIGNHCSAAMVIGANGDTFDHGIVFYSNLGTISAIEMATNQREQWVNDSTSGTLAYVTSLVTAAADANSLIFTNNGAFFYQGQSAYSSGNPGLNGAISNNPGVSVINHPVLQGAATSNPALIFAQGDDANVALALKPQIANANNANGEVLMEGPFQPQVTTVGALPSCTGATKYQIYGISDGNANLTYRSTTFTGSGTSAGIVFCNGTNWELH